MGYVGCSEVGWQISSKVTLCRVDLELEKDLIKNKLNEVPEKLLKNPACHVCDERITTKTAWFDFRRQVLFCWKCAKKLVIGKLIVER